MPRSSPVPLEVEDHFRDQHHGDARDYQVLDPAHLHGRKIVSKMLVPELDGSHGLEMRPRGGRAVWKDGHEASHSHSRGDGAIAQLQYVDVQFDRRHFKSDVQNVCLLADCKAQGMNVIVRPETSSPHCLIWSRGAHHFFMSLDKYFLTI